MTGIQPLINHISRALEEQGNWSLTIAEVAALLLIDETELYGRLYRQAHREGVRTPVSEYHYAPESAGELVRLLEGLREESAGQLTEEAFTKAGLFVPYPLRVDLQERFVRQFVADYVIHAVDLTTFDAMLRATGRADEAVGLYVDEYFPLEAAISRAAESFTRDNDYPQRMEITAGFFLATLFRRHLLDRRELLSPLVSLLRGRARDTGYIRDGSTRKRATASADDFGTEASTESRSAELRRARSLFGIRNGETTPGLIRERYKTLIRKYHPDVNPAGLEMSKRINVSYAILLESVKR